MRHTIDSKPSQKKKFNPFTQVGVVFGVAVLALTGTAAVLQSATGGTTKATTLAAANVAERDVKDRADRSSRNSASPSPASAPSAAPAPSTAPPATVAPPVVAPPAPPAPPKPTWVTPMAVYAFTSPFGERWGTIHAGADFANVQGTPIRAAAAGTVELAATYDWGGYGFAVIINHGGGTKTLYGHNSQVNVVAGQHVEAGQTIALEGSTGDSTGPHCHFEVHLGVPGEGVSNGNAVDPVPFLKGKGVDVYASATSVEGN